MLGVGEPAIQKLAYNGVLYNMHTILAMGNH